MTLAAVGRGQTNDILGSRRIDHVVVLGANGAMGYGSGALFTTEVPRVTFLARSREKAEQALQSAIQAVRSNTVAQRVEVGDYETFFDAAVGSADLVFEAVAEDLELKRKMFERVDRVRRADSIVASVSSGLSINALAADRSPSFRHHFLGLHFFNPPNVIVGTELIAGHETDPRVVEFVDAYAAKRLGRVMVHAFDTPGFAGNRIGFKLLNEVAQLAEEHGPALVERLVGPYTGRAMTPLATIDLVGWDIHKAIVDNVYDKTRDEAHATLKLPGYMDRLLAAGMAGGKSGGGFFRAEKGTDTLVLDPCTGAYRPLKEIKLPDLGFIGSVAKLHRDGRYADALRVFADAPGHWAALARRVVAGYVSYAFHRVGEATATLAGVDDIMGFGFNWAPPSVLVDVLGPREIARMMDEANVPVPAPIADAVRSGSTRRFYSNRHGNIGRFFVAG
ncbi:MAG TPA: 3-hydroxyacyl-CoA dehydrogenase family protein [Polyangiaceae bacterium]|nr:3-hydroxyacyl-CoA dehydrogenase family protein [Polyangiaceae bacterium]